MCHPQGKAPTPPLISPPLVHLTAHTANGLRIKRPKHPLTSTSSFRSLDRTHITCGKAHHSHTLASKLPESRKATRLQPTGNITLHAQATVYPGRRYQKADGRVLSVLGEVGAQSWLWKGLVKLNPSTLIIKSDMARCTPTMPALERQKPEEFLASQSSHAVYTHTLTRTHTCARPHKEIHTGKASTSKSHSQT